jgi:NADH dehydrogenase
MIKLVTLFGGGGFLGRYVAQELMDRGIRVRVAQRDPSDAWFIRSLGNIGQAHAVAADITKPESVARALAGADAAVNLVGLLAGPLEAVHVGGAANVAAAARKAKLAALVHVSAIGADPDSPSAYGRTKGEGETAARLAFPGTTIVRPSIVYGAEDQFLNRFARMASLPVLPVVRGPVKFQPVWVADVARAIVAALLDPKAHGGKTYELGGPDILSMAELNAFVAETTGHSPALVAVPDCVAAAMARFGGWAPGAPITWDQWLMLQSDNVVAADAAGFAELGIEPAPLAAIAPRWLVQYRPHGRFDTSGKVA